MQTIDFYYEHDKMIFQFVGEADIVQSYQKSAMSIPQYNNERYLIIHILQMRINTYNCELTQEYTCASCRSLS